MSTWAVTNRLTGEVVYAYTSDDPVEWPGMAFAEFNHVKQPNPEPVPDERWRIYVGAYFDRFGASKLGVLSSDDAVIQALIKDCQVRKYIDLKARRDELLQAIGYINSKGFALDPVAILDVEPTTDEQWRPFTA